MCVCLLFVWWWCWFCCCCYSFMPPYTHHVWRLVPKKKVKSYFVCVRSHFDTNDCMLRSTLFTLHAIDKESWLLISVCGSFHWFLNTHTPHTPRVLYVYFIYLWVRFWHPSSQANSNESVGVYAFYGSWRWGKSIEIRNGEDFNKVFIEMFLVWITTSNNNDDDGGKMRACTGWTWRDRKRKYIIRYICFHSTEREEKNKRECGLETFFKLVNVAVLLVIFALIGFRWR